MSFQSPAFSTPFVPFAIAQIDPVGYSGSVALMLASTPDSHGPGLLPSGAASRVARGIGSRRNTPLLPPAVTRNFTASRKSVKSFSVISQLSPSRRPFGSWRASSTPSSTVHFESSTCTQPVVSLPLNRCTGALSVGGAAADAAVAGAGASGPDLQPTAAIAATTMAVLIAWGRDGFAGPSPSREVRNPPRVLTSINVRFIGRSLLTGRRSSRRSPSSD